MDDQTSSGEVLFSPWMRKIVLMSTKLFLRGSAPDCSRRMDDKPSSRDALFSPMVAENCAHEHKSGRPVHSQITSDNEHPPFRVKKPPSLHGLGKCAHEHKALLQGSTAGLPGKWQTSPRAEKSSSTHGFGKCAHEHKALPAGIGSWIAWKMDDQTSCGEVLFSSRIPKLCS